MINVLIVDDSAFMRKVLSDLLSSDPSIKVVGTARNGADALDKVPKLKPDVITLDVEMPIMDGLQTLKVIVDQYAIPVIMVSSVTKAGTTQTIEAMQSGAIDFISKPSGSISLDIHKVQDELIQKVKVASKVKIPKEFKELPPTSPKPLVAKYLLDDKKKGESIRKKIITIGTSTGGPKALVEVISKLPKDLNAPVVVVQHMPKGFTKSLAERLNKLSELNVKEAVHGEIIHDGWVYVAPGGSHLKIEQQKEELIVSLDDDTPPTRGHRPSVDEMYFSLSKLKEVEKIAVIMTGMGTDGTNGLLSLKNDSRTIAIAESEASCIVYGMPRSAIATRQVDDIVPVKEIASRIVHHLK
ncbi:chemotaxis response regulator protein-glutamate methylesterase [Alkalihalobacillus berkeleyi]|uniref:Protein-glutamate methylesterase/protein-glutamine glutaminase n=1 Tax=Pseudalkalibacillus berkeleyi TaxID=1069813 RepID=A0ABS9GWF2_9BACL|nr:chemotaxis response regulator protein-glutamate methylesterase [Pseudalkalibacillus berkeleyi]